jgi:hypothetical protein
MMTAEAAIEITINVIGTSEGGESDGLVSGDVNWGILDD